MSGHIHPTVTTGEGSTLSPLCVIDADVTIGAGVTVGPFVHVCAGTVIGDGTSISDGAVVGRAPKLAASSTAKGGPLPGLIIGDRCVIGSHAVLMAGTTIGSDCVVGDGAGVRERCTIGDNVVVGRNVTVENDTAIGSRTRIQSGAYVTAYVTLEEDVFIAPMVVTTNDNYMGRTEKRLTEMRGCVVRRGARVGGGVHILPGIEIGEDAFIATGAVVTRDVPPRVVAMGVPARVIRDVATDELLDSQ
ncbi:MAG: DapH/DapD/GlmU-related protein [Coriobacteriia bacterium]